MSDRIGSISRQTKETSIEVELNLDGQRSIEVSTGLGFFDHMLSALAFHAGWDLKLVAKGDLEVDDHHTIEDCGITIGQAMEWAVGEKLGICRFGSKYAPLDEALARSVIDYSGRPGAVVNLGLKREMIGAVACENLGHFFQSLSMSGKFTLHVDVLRGENDHHRAEAAFKSLALALKESLAITEPEIVPSTKGAL
ncbi:MAG: imidazoleglycerol-phosphate dehydratase HisB [Planctomycetota bacterium]